MSQLSAGAAFGKATSLVSSQTQGEAQLGCQIPQPGLMVSVSGNQEASAHRLILKLLERRKKKPEQRKAQARVAGCVQPTALERRLLSCAAERYAGAVPRHVLYSKDSGK